MMHILHVIDSLSPGGAERMLVDIGNASAARGHRVSVCITRDRDDLAHELRPDIRRWVLGRTTRFDWAAMRRFASIVRDEKVDLVHAHGRTTFAFVALVKTLGLMRTPILLHDHYGQIETDASVPFWFRAWGRRCVRRYVGVYAKLGAWAESAGIPRPRIDVIGNALDLSRLLNATPVKLGEELTLNEAERIGVVVAGVRPEKGIDVLVRAVAGLHRRHALKIIIAGGERDSLYARKCREERDALGLTDTVIFVGERADVPGLIKGADFAVVPSLSESGPLVLIEFMAAGLPFVATRVGDVTHRVEGLGGAEFVPPGDADALSGALDRLLLLTPADWQERCDAGRRLATGHFAIEAAMPDWERTYRAALDEAGA